MRYVLPILVALLIALPALAEDEPTKDGAKKAGPPPELGKVAWVRDHDAGFAAAKKAKKPVFLLFQEVPG